MVDDPNRLSFQLTSSEVKVFAKGRLFSCSNVIKTKIIRDKKEAVSNIFFWLDM